MMYPVPNLPCERRRARLLQAASLALLVATPCIARAAGSVVPPSAFAVRVLVDARLMGSGLYRWWGFEVYTATLWVGTRGINPAQLTDAPFELALRYARRLKGRDIADTAELEMHRLGMGTDDERAAWLQRMRAIFPDVRNGDVLCGVFDPDAPSGPQTTFILNDSPIGRISGDAFARAFFSIWLSPKTTTPALRAALLARVQATP